MAYRVTSFEFQNVNIFTVQKTRTTRVKFKYGPGGGCPLPRDRLALRRDGSRGVRERIGSLLFAAPDMLTRRASDRRARSTIPGASDKK